jgi:hypothetical protein
MGSPPSDDEVDALLAQGRFPGPTKDRVFEGALADAGVGRPASRWRKIRVPALAGLSLAAGAAALMLFLPRSNRDDGFQVKGGSGVARLDVACVGTPTDALGACPSGATLVFSVTGSSVDGYLAAYAEPRAGGERIWYFSAEGESPRVPAVADPATGGEAAVVSKAIRIGPEHQPGDYRVRLFVTRTPLPRQRLLASADAADLLATREADLRVISPPAR